LGAIYAVKTRKEPVLKERLVNFMSEYSGVERKWYSVLDIKRTAKEVFCDYLRTADHPDCEVREFFDLRDKWHMDDTEAILCVLQSTEVQDGDDLHYVNGFRDMKL